MKILFTICGRAGSKGFKNKNLKEMNGVPLVYYTLAAIYEFSQHHPEDDISVYLNTDSKELAEIAQSQNLIPVNLAVRKEELAGHRAAKVEVIKDTFRQSGMTDADVIIDLDITSPLRKAGDIEGVLAEYLGVAYDVVFSVVKARRSPYFNMVEYKEENGYYQKICSSKYIARQQAPASFELNASIYAYDPEFLKSKIEKTILDYRCGISIMKDYLVLDIDSEEDFEMMQYLHRMYCEDDKELNKIYETAKAMLQK